MNATNSPQQIQVAFLYALVERLGLAYGTWYSDKARDGSSMEEYLNWLSEKLIAVN
jgi:hypothetical protein